MRKIYVVIAAIVAALTVSAKVTDAELLEIQKENKFSEYWGQRATLFNQLGVDSTSIVMFGNSLTDGAEWSEMFGDQRVVNRGISGDTSLGLLKRLDAIVDGKPAKIFVLIGVNDLSRERAADSVAATIIELVGQIRERTPETRLYVQSLLPFNQTDFKRYAKLIGKEQAVRDVNALIAPAVEAAGATYIDLYPYFADENGNLKCEWTNDGLHLTAAGYQVWQSLITPAMTE